MNPINGISMGGLLDPTQAYNQFSNFYIPPGTILDPNVSNQTRDQVNAFLQGNREPDYNQLARIAQNATWQRPGDIGVTPYSQAPPPQQYMSQSPSMGWGFQTQPGGYNWSQMPGMPYQNYGGQQFQPQTMQWNNPFMSQRPAQGGAGTSGIGDSYQSRTYGGQWSRPAGENRALPANTPQQPNNLWSRPATLNRGANQGRGLFYNY